MSIGVCVKDKVVWEIGKEGPFTVDAVGLSGLQWSSPVVARVVSCMPVQGGKQFFVFGQLLCQLCC